MALGLGLGFLDFALYLTQHSIIRELAWVLGRRCSRKHHISYLHNQVSINLLYLLPFPAGMVVNILVIKIEDASQQQHRIGPHQLKDLCISIVP